MECPFPGEEIDADGAFKNAKVRKKKESPPLNTSILWIFAIEPKVVKNQRKTNNFNNLLIHKEQREMKYNEGEEGNHNCYGHQAFRDTSNKMLKEKSPKVNKWLLLQNRLILIRGDGRTNIIWYLWKIGGGGGGTNMPNIETKVILEKGEGERTNIYIWTTI